MRISQGMMTRNYLKTLNSNLTNLAKSNRRMSTQQRYSRVSDNTADVARAFNVREQLYQNEQHLTNIRNAEGELAAAESNLRSINEILRNVEDRLVQASNGTIPESELKIIAREVTNLQDEMLQISNAQFGDKYLFASAGTGKAPFEVDDAGILSYNGFPVDQLEMNPVTRNPAQRVPDPDPTAAPGDTILVDITHDKDVYLDIGLGMTMVEGDHGKMDVNTKTALKISTSGLDAFGFGMSADDPTMPNNLYSLLGKAARDIENGDTESMGKDLAHIKKCTDELLMSITDIGTRTSFLEETGDRLDTDSITLKAAQKDLESISLEEESIYNKTFEMSWMVTLQLGSKLLPQTIFDFLR